MGPVVRGWRPPETNFGSADLIDDQSVSVSFLFSEVEYMILLFFSTLV